MKTKQKYHSTRNVVYAKNGMVATSQPLAAQAGLDILKQGGNAVDAAIAVAACLTVVEPTSNGIGGDNFAIVSIKDQLYGLNSSGYAPKNISIDKLKDSGITEIPRFGFVPVTVPGAVAGWVELNKRFGKLPLIDVLKPAINYARNGFAVSPTVSYYWKSANQIYQKHLNGEMFQSWFDTFTKNLAAPEAGDIWYLKDHANTLEEIGKTNGNSFYQGNLANQIDAYSKKYDGYLTKTDLESFKPEWVNPVSTHYKGYDIWELPPNGQGIIALEALNIVENFKIKVKEKVDTYHQQIESLKLAFADGLAYISDPQSMKTSVDDLLSKTYANKRFKEIENHAKIYTEGKPTSSGTVYLATADCDGNMVSMIQSNYMGFGSGLVVPNTGIALHNRGHNFTLDQNSDNALTGGKRPFHTIIPGFISKDNLSIGPFGVMGGFMQPQGHMQVVMNMIDFKLDPQQALDAPRWQWTEGKKILVEPDLPKRIIKGLMDKGHDIQIEPNLGSFGRGQIIIKNSKNGVYCGGTEKRADGSIASY
ncbi:MAG: gamma-glutamyltransferase family protein [Tenericutes bacterium]|nr:gamma-glutamyltransferase family protein [Mycoplasmatota bacterium]